MEFHIILKTFRAEDSLRSFKPQLRNCYFEGEKVLKYFKTYTKALCEFECNANYTLEKCGCVKFSMPRGKDTPICTMDDFSCAESLPQVQCDCLSPCYDLRYSFRYDKANFNRRYFKRVVPDRQEKFHRVFK
jgi:acid-sensing ion channel, other